MRVARVLVVPAILVGLGLGTPSPVLAATSEELAALATDTYLMQCAPVGAEVHCDRTLRTVVWDAVIRPETGTLASLDTAAQTGQPPLDAVSIDWMAGMHGTACGAAKAVRAFVETVGAMTAAGELHDTIGDCDMTGRFTGGALAAPVYLVSSVPLPPTPAPPTPGPTPKATPKPTKSPAPTLPPTGASAAPTATAASPSVGPAPSPTATSPITPAPSASPPAEASPEATPAPTLPPTGGVGGAGTSPPTFADTVATIPEVRADGPALVGSALLVLLLLLLIGFAGELFNNTVESNYAEIAGWFTSRRLGWLGRATGWLARHARLSVLGFVALTALVSAFLDPGFGPNLTSVAILLGFLVGLVVVLASFKLPPMLAHRRVTGELGQLRPLPWALVIAIVFVGVSRLAELQPGYLYGIVLGAIFSREVSSADEGRHTFYGSLWTLGAAVLAWVGLEWLRGQGLDESAFGVILAETACAAILVAGLEATAFGLLPLRFMPGYAVYRWNRLVWAGLFAISGFAFVHILVGPTSGYVAELAPAAFIVGLGVFAAFGALSIATWGYFRFRPQPLASDGEAA